MERIMKLLTLSVLVTVISANQKPVTLWDKKAAQLVTSSLLSWEPFQKSDAKQQLLHAVAGGNFTGEDVSVLCCFACCCDC